MNGNWLLGLSDFDRNAVVLDQQRDLLGQVGAEEIRSRDSCVVDPGSGYESVREARIQAGMGADRDANKWIGGAHAHFWRLAIRIGLEALTQEGGVALVNLRQPFDRRGGVENRFGCNWWRGQCFGRVRHEIGTLSQSRPLRTSATLLILAESRGEFASPGFGP